MASILFATDFGVASLAAAPIAVSLAEEYQAKLTLVHVKEKRGAQEMRMPCDGAAVCEQRLRALVPEDARMWCEPHFVVDCGAGDRQGAAWERILGQAEAREADLIVMGVHAPEGVPGADEHLEIATVHGVVAHARMPVLAVRGGVSNIS
jgi:nucleotide-binding universal stress UspA family protein